MTDVWSFGILLHEVFDDGKKPYTDMTNAVVVARVSQGYRLPRLPECPEKLYALMLRCWSIKAEDRPTFATIKKALATERKHSDPKGASSSTASSASALASLQGSQSRFSTGSRAQGGEPAHEYVYQDEERVNMAESAPPPTAPRLHDYVYELGDAVATLVQSVDGFAEESAVEVKPVVTETNLDEYMEVAMDGEMEV